MSKSTITSKGQTTIPADIRAFLGVKAGDTIEFVAAQGQVFILPKRYKAMDLFGILPKPPKPVSIEEMKQGVIDAVVAKYERSLPKHSKKTKK